MSLRVPLLLFALALTACADGTGSDAGLLDTGPRPDGGATPLDATTPDGGFAPDAAADAGEMPDAGPMPDAGEMNDNAGLRPDASMEDAGVQPDASMEDAGLPDPEDAGPPDGGEAPADGGFAGPGDTCPVPPVMVDGPFAPGPPPPTANLLLTDTASNAVFRLALDGQVLDQWPTPLAAPFGVTYDKRNPDGFFVNGRAAGINAGDLFRISFAGTVTATLTYYAPNGTIWGMDYLFGSTPQLDVLGFMNRNFNSLPTITGALASDATRRFEGGLFQPPNAQWYGAHFERYTCDNGVTIVYWTTRSGNVLELRDWGVNAPLRSYTIPGTNDARGLTRTPRGDFYVVDREHRRILHLAPDITLIDSFLAPGTQPADLSYRE